MSQTTNNQNLQLNREQTSFKPYSGFSLGSNTEHAKYDAFYHCLLKGILVFAASFGLVSGILSEFDIEYNYVLVFAIMLVTSMSLTLLHLNKILFNVGYPALFLVYSYELIIWRAYANSGFQAFVNIVSESYGSHFQLNFSKEYQEIITDRYATITCTAIFVGIFMAILVNVGIFNDMYFITTVMLTFMPLQLGIFIGSYPSVFSLGLLFFSYFAIYFLKHSGHYHFINTNDKRPFEFYFKQKQKNYIYHKSSARNMLHLGLFALIASLFFSLFTSAGIRSSENQAVTSGTIKQTLDDYAMILTQNGLMGLFDRYSSKGGVSGGKLGGVRSVRPDYQTDLEVTFVPYAFETIYLKSFVGQVYDFDQWIEASTELNYQSEAAGYLEVSKTISWENDLIDSKDEEVVLNNYHYLATYNEEQHLEMLTNMGIVPSMTATFRIKNVDANEDYPYIPYYASSLPDYGKMSTANTIIGTSPIGQDIELQCIPYASSYYNLLNIKENIFSNNYFEEEKIALQFQKREVYNNYLSVPSSIYQDISLIQKEIGTGKDLEEQVKLIQDYFVNNFTYTMSPGTTPWNEDFVTYFLTKQRRGYCAHFASSATLLLRAYGYPARYVEGYVIKPSTVAEATVVDEPFDKYFQGENKLGVEEVVTVEVNDGSAHAWVEVYNDNFGWIPVEFTPPSTENEDASYGDFLSALTSLFQGNISNNSENTTETNNQTNTHNDLFSSLHFKNASVVYVFISILVIITCIPLIIRIVRYLKMKRKLKNDYRNGRYKSNLSYHYQKLTKKLKRKYNSFSFVLPEDVANFINAAAKTEGMIRTSKQKQLNKFINKNELSIDEIMELLQKYLYSSNPVSKVEADQILNDLKELHSIVF